MLQMLLPLFYPAAVLVKVGLDLLLSNPNPNPNPDPSPSPSPSPSPNPNQRQLTTDYVSAVGADGDVGGNVTLLGGGTFINPAGTQPPPTSLP